MSGGALNQNTDHTTEAVCKTNLAVQVSNKDRIFEEGCFAYVIVSLAL